MPVHRSCILIFRWNMCYLLSQVADYRLDVRDPAAIKSVFDDIETNHGLPDLIVNNAAGNFISPSERLSPNAFAVVINIVLNGTAYITLDVGKRLIKAKKGNIVKKTIFTEYVLWMKMLHLPSWSDFIFLRKCYLNIEFQENLAFYNTLLIL